jgi:hypothetical protein
MTTNRPSLLKAFVLSSIVALAGSPLFAAWLLAQYTSESLASPAALQVILKMSLLWGLGSAAASFLALVTYGLLVRALLIRLGHATLVWFVGAGILPGALLLLTSLPYQESAVPAIYFGALSFAAFWYFSVRHAGTGANNSFKPNPLRGSA